MTANRLLDQWSNGEETLGLWVSFPDPRTAEFMATLDFDHLTVDLQHGMGTYEQMVSVFQAMAGSDMAPTVRVPWNEPGIIGRVLDAGAQGVIIPMVNSVAEARDAIEACHYPPLGRRSYGPIRAAMSLGPDYYQSANQRVACICMIETAAALDNIDEICAMEGLDAVYVGPADLSLSLGLAHGEAGPPGNDHDDPIFTEALLRIVAACEANGVIPGIHCQPSLVDTRRQQGFKLITADNDIAMLMTGGQAGLATARKGSGT